MNIRFGGGRDLLKVLYRTLKAYYGNPETTRAWLWSREQGVDS